MTESKNELALTPTQQELQSQLGIENDLDDFGADVMSKIASTSDEVLDKVQTRDLGDIGNQLITLQTKVKNAKFDANSHSKLYNFFHKAKNNMIANAEQYRDAKSMINEITHSLDQAADNLRDRVSSLKEQQKNEIEYDQQLVDLVQAVEAELDRIQQKVLPGLEKAVKDDPNNTKAQVELQQYQEYTERLQRKIIDLQSSREVINQDVGQLSVIIAGNNTEADQIRSANRTLSSLWKTKAIASVATVEQRQAIQMKQGLVKATNEMMLDSAKRLRENTQMIIKEKSTPVINVDTVKQVKAEMDKMMESLVDNTQETISKQQKQIEELNEMAKTDKNIELVDKSTDKTIYELATDIDKEDQDGKK